MLYFLFLILSFFHKLGIINSIIVVPFKINSYIPKTEGESNITDLINEYLIHDMFATIEIGSNPNTQKVTTLISPEESILSLSSNVCKKKSLESINDLSIVSQRGLDINSYNSDIINKQYINYLDKENNIGLINDLVYMYNSTFLSCQPIEYNNKKEKDSKVNINDISIPIKDKNKDNNEKLCAILGVGSPLNVINNKLNNIPNFINYLKKNKIINDYSWTFKFHTKKEGRLIIGDLPHNYELNTRFFNEDKLIKRTTYSPEDPVHPWSLHFKEISFTNSNNEIVYVGKWIKMILISNIGFIIGDDKYKNLILENYFKTLIDKNICVLEKTNITKYTKSEIYFGTSGIYEVFHCDKKGLVFEQISFPKLNFAEPQLNYTFSLTFSNLFELINNRYYFLVIFPEDIDHAAYKVWYLGLPFYYTNQFIFNYDLKTIGLYDQNINITQKDSDSEKKETDGDNKNENNGNNKRNIWFIILEVVAIIILIVIAFFLGKKINENRKKRANELNDDNYDYISNEENIINEADNN